MTPFHWAIVGPGAIAHRFADAVHRLPHTELALVCGRDAQRSADFARNWCRDGHTVKSSTALADVLNDPAIDGVYIATPHSHHAPPALQALAAGKVVLCEKALTPSRASAVPLVEASRQHHAFLMEAVWTRFLPLYATVAEWIRGGRIGALQGIQSSFCFDVTYDPRSRLFDPALAGGCLLDIGIYNLSLSRWIIAQQHKNCPEPEQIHCHGVLAPTGVEQRVSAALHFDGGLVVQFICGFDGHADNGLRILGERGHIVIPGGFWEATRATLCVAGHEPQHIHAPFAINGFEYEIEETIRCARAGLIESPAMPHTETLATLEWIDRMRSALDAVSR